MEVSWAELKQVAADLQLVPLLRAAKLRDGTFYLVWIDGVPDLVAHLVTDEARLEYDSDFLPKRKLFRTSEGLPVLGTCSGDPARSFNSRSYLLDAPGSGVHTGEWRIDDTMVGQDALAALLGGSYQVVGEPAKGDYLRFYILDKDGVVVPAGTETSSPIPVEHLIPNTGREIHAPAPALLTRGLYLCVAVHAYGSIPYWLRVQFTFTR